MRLEISFFGVAGDVAFTGVVYRFRPTLLRAQIRFIPKGMSLDDTVPLPGTRRSSRHIVEGLDGEEVLAKLRSFIEQHAGQIESFELAPRA
jgi:hypothetical protein